VRLSKHGARDGTPKKLGVGRRHPRQALSVWPLHRIPGVDAIIASAFALTVVGPPNDAGNGAGPVRYGMCIADRWLKFSAARLVCKFS
jgi:hypothetical protein